MGELSMPDFSAWELKTLSVDNIRLDPKNPRLPEDLAGKSQAKIIAHLLEEEDIITIAKSIRDNGVFIDKVPIIVNEKGKFTVIDGNRRLTALKLIRNPDLAPKRKSKQYEMISKSIDIEQLQKINVAVAPSREDAEIRIYLEHAESLSRPWKRLMKHRFIADSILLGKTIEEIAERFSIPVSEVKTAASEIMLRDLATNIDLDKSVLKNVLHQDFPLSTLTRIISTKSFLDKTGFKIDGRKIQTKLGEKTFKNIMRHIFSDLATGGKSVDDLKKKEQRNAYIEDIFKESLEADDTEGFEYVPEAPKNKPETTNAKPPKNGKGRKGPERLIPQEFNSATGLEKLNTLLVEGKSLSIGQAKNASGMLLRAILECSIYQVFAKNGKVDRVLNEQGRVKGLKSIIKQLTGQADWFTNRTTLEKFQRFASDDNPTFIHIETLHQIVHDQHFTPTTEELKQFWLQIMPIVLMCQEENEEEE